MKRKLFHFITIFCSIIACGFSISCTTSFEAVYPTLSDGKYDSEFPYKNSSEQLEAIGNTIKRINSIAYYSASILKNDSKITLNQLSEPIIKQNLKQTVFFQNTSSGTSVVVSNSNGYVALLTCAHIVDFPDTIITYFVDDEGNLTNYVESVSIKENQRNYAAGFPGGSEVEILLFNRKIDAALLGNKYSADFARSLTVFDYPNGTAKELEWGSFVYVFGFPLNYKMISRALVSEPNYDGEGSFLIDAVVNRGFSGGIVLAIKDGIPNFELVGLVKWMPEETNYVLVPKNSDQNYSPIIPYEGDEYILEQKDFIYGITKVVPIDLIKEYILSNKDYLLQKGYYLRNFFQ